MKTPILLSSLLCFACSAPRLGDDPESIARAAELARRIADGDAEARTKAVAELRDLGVGGVRAACPLLASDDPEVVRSAVRTIAAITAACSDHPRRGAAVTAAVLDGLARASGAPPHTRAEVVRALGVTVAGAGGAQRLAALLDERDLAESALFALERSEHAAAGQALLQALQRQRAVPASSIVHALANRRSTNAVPALIEMARASRDAEACCAALARIGDPAAATLLMTRFADRKPGAARDWLRYLEERSRQGDTDPAIRDQYEGIAAGRLQAPAPVRLAALAGLQRFGGPQAFDAFLLGLGDPDRRVRGVARAALIAHPGDDAGAELAAALSGASATLRIEVLRVLTARKDERALPLVKEATSSPATSVAAAAYELLGQLDDPAIAPMLLRAAKPETRPEIRAAAIASLNAIAGRRIASGDAAGALPLVHGVLVAAEDEAARRTALGHAGAIGSPDLLEPVQDAASLKSLQEPAARAKLAIAKKLTDRAAATNLLNEIYRTSGNRGTRAEAAAELRRRGVDTSGFALRKGFLPRWHVLGPFEKPEKDSFGRHPFGAGGPDLAREYVARGKDTAWVLHLTTDPDAHVDLRFLKPNNSATAYAVCDVEWPDDAKVTLKVGSDDQVAIWVNGTLVHESWASRSLKTDQDIVGVKFRKGKNRILVKVGQGGGGWGFCVRVADAHGRLLDLR